MRKKRNLLKSRINLLVDGGDQQQPVRLSAPRWLLYATGTGAGLVLLAISIFGFSSGFQLNSHSRLSKKNSAYMARYNELASQVDSLSGMLALVEEHDIRVRLYADMTILPPDARKLGVGGSNDESSYVTGLREIKSNHYDQIAGLSQRVDELLRKSTYQIESFAEIEAELDTRDKMIDRIPSVVPTYGRFSSKFGYRKDPILGIKRKHNGVDITNRIGTPVIAPADGVVIFTGRLGGYGKVVKIDHGDQISTVYAHLSDFYVTPGQKIRRFQTIAAIGNTGRTVGPHLHYEVRIAGKAVDPERYFTDGEERLTQYPMP